MAHLKIDGWIGRRFSVWKGLPSFSSIDFGPCFVGGLGHVPSKTYLLGHVGQDWDGHHLHAQENSRLVRSRNVELIKELFGVPSI